MQERMKSEKKEKVTMKYTESMASNFIPVDRMKRCSSGLTGSMYLPQPRIKISEISKDAVNTATTELIN